MKRKREVFLSVVLLAGILVFASACSASKKEQEAASQSGTEQASDKETADKQTTEEQASGTAAAGEQTNSTQVSDVKPENETSGDKQEAGVQAGEAQAETDASETPVEKPETASAEVQESGSEKTVLAGDLPIITENPTDESLTEGYSCMYIASAENADKAEWRAVSPDGKIDIPYAEVETYFPYMEYVGINQEAISLFNIPADFDGWGSYCRFTNSVGSADSATAVTHVTPIEDTEPEKTDQDPIQAENVGS